MTDFVLTGVFSDAAIDAPLHQNNTTINSEASPLYRKRTPEQVNHISDARAREALLTDATATRILEKGKIIKKDQLIGVRLNINVLRNTGVAVNTIHAGNTGQGYKSNKGLWGGEVISYQPTVTLINAYFNVHQKLRDAIAKGVESKSPMASIDGEFVSTRRHSFDGVEFKFNPKREHLFRDENGCVVKMAEEVTICGNSAFARGLVEYYSEHNAPEKAGDAPSEGRFFERSR